MSQETPESSLPPHLSFLGSDVEEVQASEEEVEVQPEQTTEVQPEQTEEVEEAVEESETDKQIKGLLNEIKGLREDRRQLRQGFEQMRQMFHQQAQATEQEQQPQAPPAPSREEDPAGYLEWKLDQGGAEINKRLEQLTGYVDQQKQVNQVQQVLAGLGQEQARFAKDHPDYNDAVAYAKELRVNMYKAMGYDDAQARQYVTQVEEPEFVFGQLRQGRSYEDVVRSAYDLAHNLGFQPTNGQQEQAEGQVQNQPQQQPQKKMKSLSQMSSSARRTGKLDGEGFDNLPESEQLKIASDREAWEQYWRDLGMT